MVAHLTANQDVPNKVSSSTLVLSAIMSKFQANPGEIIFTLPSGSFKILDDGSLSFEEPDGKSPSHEDTKLIAQEFANYISSNSINKSDVYIKFDTDVEIVLKNKTANIEFNGFVPTYQDMVFWKIVKETWGNITMICTNCKIQNEYAKPNQSNGTYICYNCR